MGKIKCPQCGHWQEAYPHIALCNNCYADISDVLTAHLRKRGDGIAHTPQHPEASTEEQFIRPTSDASKASKQALTVGRKRRVREEQRLSGSGVIIKRTCETFLRRFWPLYPLMYVSLSFLMLIGLFTSAMGVQIVFPDQYPSDPAMGFFFAVGVGASLFIFFYTQAAFALAVTDRDLGLGDAMSRALSRLVSYVALLMLMVIVIGLGTAAFLIPGIVAAVVFSFAPLVHAKEGVGIGTALVRSVKYFAGAWLQVLLRLVPVAALAVSLWFFFAYVGVPLLMLVRNEVAFVFIISALMGLPLMFAAILLSTIYDDLLRVPGLQPAPAAAPLPVEEEAATTMMPAVAGLLPFTSLLGRSWTLYRHRFVPLTVLNVISYIPHALHIGMLLGWYFGARWFFETFHATGEFGLLIFLILPKWMLALLMAAVLVCFILYALGDIFGLMLYLLLELAYVHVVADSTVGVFGAIRKARKRLRGFFWAILYRNFIVSTGWTLLIPGVVFWVWYEFAPYVFALQRKEGTPLSSLFESKELVRGLWGKVFGRLVSLRFLPIVIVAIIACFTFAGLPFYWIFGVMLFPFIGHHLPGMLTLYSPHFWTAAYLSFALLIGGFYLPFQNVFMYLLYENLKEAKTPQEDQPATM
jgi:hypothetical protein